MTVRDILLALVLAIIGWAFTIVLVMISWNVLFQVMRPILPWAA